MRGWIAIVIWFLLGTFFGQRLLGGLKGAAGKV